jgi:hypothetical protein
MGISLYGAVVTPAASIVNEESEGLIRYSSTFRRGPIIEDMNQAFALDGLAKDYTAYLSLPRAREIAK